MIHDFFVYTCIFLFSMTYDTALSFEVNFALFAKSFFKFVVIFTVFLLKTYYTQKDGNMPRVVYNTTYHQQHPMLSTPWVHNQRYLDA